MLQFLAAVLCQHRIIESACALCRIGRHLFAGVDLPRYVFVGAALRLDLYLPTDPCRWSRIMDFGNGPGRGIACLSMCG